MILDGKVVLVTGGTGSFGKAFTKKALESGLKKLIIFSRDELKQSEMAKEFTDERIRFFIGDVRDRDRLYRAFDGVDVVVHAAALKRVDSAEYNPFEFIKTNVYGSQNVIDAAIDRKVAKVVALSTDKACQPQTTYGSTKHLMERMVIAANNYSGNHTTKFSCVRYGNVLGSRGSVVPLFKKIRQDGRVYPVTDPSSTRFWITMDQAVDLVLEAVQSGGYGGIYVPKIPSSSLQRLVEAIDPEGIIKVIGLRGTEKLHETLIADYEVGWELDKYYIIGESGQDYEQLGPYRSDTNPNQPGASELRKLVYD